MPQIARRAVVTIIALAAVVASMLAIAPAADADADEPQRITLAMSECGVMAVGVTGTCIISLQSWLNIFDNAGLVVDGKFGPATEAAVRNFQLKHGLDADGRFGDHSRNALRGEYQYMMEHSVPSPKPAPLCDLTTGEGCASGEAVPGFNGGDVQSIFCELTGPFDLFCDVILN
jgi:peptidoglycan hydrolase-like protein with peptidoglycan-binding domain